MDWTHEVRNIAEVGIDRESQRLQNTTKATYKMGGLSKLRRRKRRRGIRR